MKKTIYLSILSVVTVICVLIGCGIHVMGWWNDFIPSIGKRINEDIKVSGFTGISADIKVGEVTIEPGEDYGLSYECTERLEPEYRVENGTLVITQEEYNERVIGFWNFARGQKCSIRVTVPQEAFLGQLVLDANVGSVTVRDIKAEKFKADIDVSDLKVDKCAFGAVDIESDVADINLEAVEFEVLEVNSNIGDVSVNGEDEKREYTQSNGKGKSISIETDIGDIKVSGD